jgi:hypothetical protein
MRKKMNQRLMNEDRTGEEFWHDLKRITEPKHVQRNATNPAGLRYSAEFLKAFNPPKNIKDGASPNLLDDHNYNSEETELGTEAITETPLASNTTPSNFLPKKIETTICDGFAQEPDDEQDLDDDSLATANKVPFQTATQDFERTLKCATKNLTNIDQEDHIQQLLIKVISKERHKSIKTAIQQELIIALNDEEMDLQQTEVLTTLGQRITTAEAIEKLLDKRITKARNNYESIKSHQEEFEEKNNALVSEVHRVDQLITQTQELAHTVWEKYEQHVKQTETKQRKVFDGMLERATLQRTCIDGEKVSGQDQVRQQTNGQHSPHWLPQHGTWVQERLNMAYDKHRASMKEQITNMNDLAESLVKQAPMSVASEIEVAKEDAIAELQTAIQNTKNKAIAQWDITAVMQDMLHGLESKIDNTMDQIIDKRKTEFQTIQQDMENLIERRRTEFESHVEVFIENEIGKHEDSTLHHSLTIALAKATKNAKKAVDDYIAMRKQELEDEILEINCNMSYNNNRNMSNNNDRQEHGYTHMPPHPSHND